MHIHIINKGYPLAKGVAYSPYSSSLLLNVPNGNMSALPDIPDHFINWLKMQPDFKKLPDEQLAADFSPREKYGNYLAGLWRQALDQRSNNITISVYDDEAFDIVETGKQFYVYLKNHHVLVSDRVVIATGNVQPRLPTGIPVEFCRDQRYFNSPWKKTSVENIEEQGDILIIGNGLTMADTVTALAASGFKNKIYTVSPHGYNLNCRTEPGPAYPAIDIKELLSESPDLHKIVKHVNYHRKAAKALNLSTYPIVDSLRPYIPQLWQSLTGEEKARFMKYLRHLWDSIRHRLPLKVYNLLNEMRASKQLITIKGRITAVEGQKDHVAVELTCNEQLHQLKVQRIINCTGPESSLKLSSNELLRNLEKSGLVCQDNLGLGINADPESGCVTNKNGATRPGLYVIGTNIKGMLWESTAVPELRVQAQKLALLLVETVRESALNLQSV